MVSNTSEQALEACIEKQLTGSSKEERQGNIASDAYADYKRFASRL